MEFLVTPDTTHILIEHIHDSRRIYTDGRPWPAELDPSFRGHTIGQWQDTDGDGRYDTLIAETRHFQGPRYFDGTGLPLHGTTTPLSGSGSVSTSPTPTSSSMRSP